MHSEPLLAVDPTNAEHVIACSDIWWPELNEYNTVAAYVSFDGGRSWRATFQFQGNGGDPICNISVKGTTFVGMGGTSQHFLMHPGPPPKVSFLSVLGEYLARSGDGGLTWSPLQYIPYTHADDREFITIDTTHSRYRGRMYFHSMSATTTEPTKYWFGLGYSTDDGKTFSHWVHATPYLPLQAGPSTVLSNGTLVLLYTKNGAAPSSTPVSLPVSSVTSTDGGKTFSSPHLVGIKTLPGKYEETSTGIAGIASDITNGPFHNRLYAVWNTLQFGTLTVVVAHSDDAGATWSAPVLANDTIATSSGVGADTSNPAIAVNKNGVVGVVWYDRRGIHDGVGGTLRFSASIDGGETFSPSVPVATAASLLNPAVARESLPGYGGRPGSGVNRQIDVTLGIYSRMDILGGDTTGFAADTTGIFHPLWIDNRTGIPQLWTARVAVNGAAVRNGNLHLSSLQDVSDKIGISLSNAILNRKTRTISVNAKLVNASATPIRGPIQLRVIGLSSVLGIPEITSSDNGQHGLGAIWRFQVPHPLQTLATGDYSTTRRLVFEFSSLRRLNAYLVHVPLENHIAFTVKAYAVP